MNFVQDDVDLSTIIKNYKRSGNVYTIEYFDNSYSQYAILEEDEEQKIKNIMINQAIARDDNYNVKQIMTSNRINIANCILSSSVLAYTFYSQKYLFSILMIGTLSYSLRHLSKNAEKIKELKKYKLFFELMNDLDNVNKPNILKCVEFDNIYQIPLDINTLDEYSYGQVKEIYKTYYKSKNNRD